MASVILKIFTLLPIFTAVLMVLGLLSCYAIAVARNDVNPWFPDISHSGGSPPESGLLCIIDTLVAISVSTMAVTMWLANSTLAGDYNLIKWNKVNLISGLLCPFGLIVVGINPVRGKPLHGNWKLDVLLPHMLGALVAFGSGFVYIVSHMVITFKMRTAFKTPFFLFLVRLTIIGTSTLALILCVVFNFKHFNDTMSGEEYQNIPASLMEWLLYFSYAAYILTTQWELSKASLTLSVSTDLPQSRTLTKKPLLKTIIT